MHRSRNILRRTALSAAAVIVFGGIALTGADQALSAQPVASMATTATHATQLQSGDAINGMVPFTQPIHIEVSLKLRNTSVLNGFIQAAGQPNATQRTMPTEQFLAQHSPTAEQAQAVVDYLTQSGFHNIVVAPNRLLVSADGTADIVQTAFQTSLARVQTSDGRDAFANTEDAHVPANLKDIVLAVLGLQTVHQAHTFARVQDPDCAAMRSPATSRSSSRRSTAARALRPRRRHRSASSRRASITQTITDLNTFTSQHGLPTVTTQTVNTNGTSTDTSGVGEWNLDSQDIVGMGGGQVQQIIFYNIPTLSNAELDGELQHGRHGQRGEDHQRVARRMRNVRAGRRFGGRRTRSSRRPSRRARRSRSRPATPVPTNAATAASTSELAGRLAVRDRGRRHDARCVDDDVEQRSRLERSRSGQRRDRRQPEHVRAEAELAERARVRAPSRCRRRRVRRRPNSGAKIIVNGASAADRRHQPFGADLRGHVGTRARGQGHSRSALPAADLCAAGEQLPRRHLGQQQWR